MKICPGCGYRFAAGCPSCPSCRAAVATVAPELSLLSELREAPLERARPARSSRVRAWLTTAGPPLPARIDLEGALLIGRGPIADLDLKLRNVSRRHALVILAEEGWSVLDLGSKNGVFVNDERVVERSLEDGDRVRVGIFELTFHAEDLDESHERLAA